MKLQVLCAGLAAAAAPARRSADTSTALFGSASDAAWYDYGWHGLHPEQHFESFSGRPPRPFVRQHGPACDATDEYIFTSPRGLAFSAPGPVVYDTNGSLVWMDTQYGQAMDLKVQTWGNEQYLTFWHGSDNGTFGEGEYYLLNASYEVAHVVRPAGAFRGDLHEFRLTDHGTALLTMYHKQRADLRAFGLGSDGWIIDSLFQELDLATGRLVFQWRASDHFNVSDTLAPIGGHGRSAATAFDYFHINSVDRTAGGDYVVSSRYLCTVVGIDGATGAVQWQLGGRHNSFRDLSGGQATNMHWQHHASWHDASGDASGDFTGNFTGDFTGDISVFDNGAYDGLRSAPHSRGLRVHVDLRAREATLVQAYVAPEQHLAPSQGSVQLLGSTNVLVGWGYIPAYTEFSSAGVPLCDVHLCPTGFYRLGWCKNYRTFKHRWVGRPRTPPAAAMRPAEDALYASWNGATEVRAWQLEVAAEIAAEIAAEADDRADAFAAHGQPVPKTTFETRLHVPATARWARVRALAADGSVLGTSAAVATNAFTTVAAMPAPPPGRTVASVYGPYAACVIAGIVAAGAAVRWRSVLLRHASALYRRARGRSQQYQPVPTAMHEL